MFNKRRIFSLVSVLCACFTGDVFSATRAVAVGSESNMVQRQATVSRTTPSTNRTSTLVRQNNNVTGTRRQNSQNVISRDNSKSVSDNVTVRTANVNADKANSARTAITPVSGSARSATTQRGAGQAVNKSPSRSATVQRINTNKDTSRATTTARVAISINNSEQKQTVLQKELDEANELLTYCQTQYANCMDEYCNILDEDMGRCSCSNNIKNYSKTSEALKSANSALQDVAQQIQYIGLSAKDIETLFSETEAEASLSVNSDDSQLKNDLDKIKKMIIDVKPVSSTVSTSNTGISMDLSGLLSFDFSASEFNLNSLFDDNSTNTSISNQRGISLYKNAASRCKENVLSYCTQQGISEKAITNSYDLKIDKDCLSYEKFLKESNKNMSNTIRNAENVLRKARLMVRQNANTYDLRGCVTALDECMRSDFVCGSNYENCLDPSGKYIVGGEIVIGSEPGIIGNYTSGVYQAWLYAGKSPWNETGTLTEYIENKLWDSVVNSPSADMADYLQYRIGYYDKGINSGLCMGVLNQCQDYTYSKDSKGEKQFNFGNSVIQEYLVRVLPEIKHYQDTILEEYSQDCITDVRTCLTTNGYGTTSNNIAINACKNMITTCHALTDTNLDMTTWVACLTGPDASGCSEIEPTTDTCPTNYPLSDDQGCYQECEISCETQCPPNATCTNNSPATGKLYVNGQCDATCPESSFECNANFYRSGNSCVACNVAFEDTDTQTESIPHGTKTQTKRHTCYHTESVAGSTEAAQCTGTNDCTDWEDDDWEYTCDIEYTLDNTTKTCKKECSETASCPDGYTDGGTTYDSCTKTPADACYKSCNTKCTGQATCPAHATCSYNTNYTTSGTQYYGGSCSAASSLCPVSSLECDDGYTGTACVANTYTISYELNNGSQASSGVPTSYTYGTGATINGVPTRSGYTFAGWCTDSGLASCSMSQSISTTATGNKTFYAKWTANTYTITYAAGQGGSGSISSGTATYNTNFTPATPSSSTITKANATFAGWAVSGTSDIKPAGTAFNWTYTENKTFTATWNCDTGYNLVGNNCELACSTSKACSSWSSEYNQGTYNECTQNQQTSCYKNVTRGCTQNNAPVPTGCSSITQGTCRCTGGTYKKYANGTTSGTTTNETCTKSYSNPVAKPDYYVSGNSCKTCSSFNSAYPKSDGGKNLSRNYCYAEKTDTGNQDDGSIPANCESVTEWNSCTPGTCTYKDYYNATDTTCTPTDCIKTPKTVTAKANYYASGTSCPACPSAYPNSAAGSSSINDCYLTLTAGNYVATAGAGAVTCACGGYCTSTSNIYYGGSVSGRATTGGWTGCGAGKYNSSTGSSASSACSTAAAGYVANSSCSATKCTGATYQDETGKTTCKSCPTATALASRVTGYWYWSSTGVQDAVDGCRANITENDSNGNYSLSCAICNGDYGVNSCNSSKCMASVPSSCVGGYYWSAASSGNVWNSTAETIKTNACIPVGDGYYSGADSLTRTQCPAADSGWTAHTTSTTSTAYSACYESQTPANCSSGTVKRAASSATAYSSTITLVSQLSSEAGYYASSTATSCTKASAGYYAAAGATSQTACTTTSGWTTTSPAGSSAYTACYQTQTPANCSSGTIKRTASSISGTTITYGSASVTSALSSEAGYYVNSTACSACGGNNYYCAGGTAERKTVSSGYYSTGGDANTRTGQSQCTGATYCSGGVQSNCPANYTANTTAGKTAATSCQITTTAGQYIKTVNDTTQTQCPAGSFCPSTTVNYGSTGGITACSSGTSSKYTSSAAGADKVGKCYLTLTAGKQVASAGAGASDCSAGNYCTSTADIYYNTDGGTATYTGTQCVAGSYSTAGASACTACGAGKTSTAGATSSSACTSCTAITNLNAWATTSWNSSNNTMKNLCTVGTCLAGSYKSGNTCPVCTGNTYSSAGATSCAGCLSNYKISGTSRTDHDSSSDCKISCGGGSYLETANDTTCTNVGEGYWAEPSIISQGSAGARTACTTGLTTIGYGTGADEVDDCGRKLHIGDDVMYLRSARKTNPSLIVDIDRDGWPDFYANVSETDHLMSIASGKAFRYENNNKSYFIYDDSYDFDCGIGKRGPNCECVKPCSMISSEETQYCQQSNTVPHAVATDCPGGNKQCIGQYLSNGCYSANEACNGCSAWGECDAQNCYAIKCEADYYLNGGTCNACGPNSTANGSTTTCTCNTGYSSDGTVNGLTTTTSSGCSVMKLTCSAGQYVNWTSKKCETCPAGSYCPGGEQVYTSELKSYACDSGYTTDGGARASTQCYRACTKSDVSHSKTVSGIYYQGGSNNTCAATSCDTNYYMNGGTCNACGPNSTANGSTTTCTCNTGYSSDGTVNGSTTTTSSGCSVMKLTCSAGQYANWTSKKCETCPAGSYCPGGTHSYSNTGKTPCPNDYASSASGARVLTQCYRACTTSDVSHSKTVSGIYYQGGSSNTCAATSCDTGANYYLNNGECNLCSANSFTYTENPQSIANGNKSVQHTCTAVSVGSGTTCTCSNETLTTIISCNTGYQQSGEACKLDPSQALTTATYSGNNWTVTLPDGSQLTGSGHCSKDENDAGDTATSIHGVATAGGYRKNYCWCKQSDLSVYIGTGVSKTNGLLTTLCDSSDCAEACRDKLKATNNDGTNFRTALYDANGI